MLTIGHSAMGMPLSPNSVRPFARWVCPHTVINFILNEIVKEKKKHLGNVLKEIHYGNSRSINNFQSKC